MTTPNKSYSELMLLNTFEDRFNYLRLDGTVGAETFGFNRYLNQLFYHKRDEWRIVRRHVCLRDNNGDYVCDLAIPDRPIINERVYVHHIVPITEEDILEHADWILDPEFLISTRMSTHNAIHYGDEHLLIHEPVIRRPNDTCPWR